MRPGHSWSSWLILPPNAIPELSSGKSLVLFCASGGRSALAAKTLKDMGYEPVAHLPVDLAPWKRQAPRPNTSELASLRARISWQSGGGADDLHPPREDKASACPVGSGGYPVSVRERPVDY